MTIEKITAADDPRLQGYRRLPRRKTRERTSEVIAEGGWLVERLLASDADVESIFCAENLAEDLAKQATGVPIYVAERAMIEEVVGFKFHRGVLACGRRPQPKTLADLAGQLSAQVSATSLLAICVGVCDQENLGSVIRNCAALGADALVVDSRCADPFSRRALRVSMGAALTLPIVESKDLPRDLQALRGELGFQISAAVLSESAIPLRRAAVPHRAAVLFGNEGFGLDETWLPLCDQQVKVAMHGEVDSLNIAVAAGIILHHFAEEQRIGV